MKKVVSAIFLVLLLFQFIAAQEKPITQAEYVKMLYALQKSPGSLGDIVAALRRRGIDFEVTDGVRSLTKSKGANDEELKRALEEAGRRKQNPESAKIPPPKEAAEILEKARNKTLTAVKEMPDFVVKQLVARSAAYAGTGNWKPLDNLTIAVSYSEKDGEQYKVLAVNGAQVNAERGKNYSGLNGATTGGEFVEDLETIFKPESKTEFTPIETDVIRGRAALVYEYSIKLGAVKNMGLGFKGAIYSSVDTGQKGRIWIDVNTFRVLKIESQATDIPSGFPLTAFETRTDYDFVEIAGEKYLLPILSDGRFTSQEGGQRFQSRNLIRFKNYQKFGTDVTILDDDAADMPTDEKPKP